MRSSFYLYCNSKASAGKNQQGFVVNSFHPSKGKIFGTVSTTPEFAFAKEFNTQREAEDFIKKNKLCVILFERRNLDY